MTAPGVCNVPVTLAPDFPQNEWFLSGAQRHRAVMSGIWELPMAFQVSGLYFGGSGINQTSVPGADIRLSGQAGYPGRLRRDGSLIDRNNVDVPALHRVDMRVQRRFRLRHAAFDGLLEVFNLFDHANYASFNANEASASFRTPVRDANVA